MRGWPTLTSLPGVHTLWFSKGGGLDFATIRNVKVEGSNIPTLAKAARMGHPAE
jgi:hypothetical protein